MVDFNKLVDSITAGGIGTGLAGGVAGGALVGALGSKSGRKAVKSVAQVGGLAAIGALAWQAYKRYQGDRAAPAAPAGTAAVHQPAPVPASTAVWEQLPQAQFDAITANPGNSEGLMVLRAMIAAAMADGHLGANEQMHIFERLDRLGLSSEERATLFDELRNPLSANALAAQVRDPVLAIEVYSAAAMVLENGCETGSNFLHGLAAGLNLPPALTQSIGEQALMGRAANTPAHQSAQAS